MITVNDILEKYEGRIAYVQGMEEKEIKPYLQLPVTIMGNYERNWFGFAELKKNQLRLLYRPEETSGNLEIHIRDTINGPQTW